MIMKFLIVFLLLNIFTPKSYSQGAKSEKVVTIKLNETPEEIKKKVDEKYAALKYLMDTGEPLTVTQLKYIQDKELDKQATLSEINHAKSYSSSVVYTKLEPGSNSVSLNLTRGLPLSVVFKDMTGNPVNIYNVDALSKQFMVCRPGFCGSDAANSTGDSNYPQNILLFTARQVFGGGNILVFTSLSDFPISFNVKINKEPGETYIDRQVVVIDDGSSDVMNGGDDYQIHSKSQLTRVINNLKPTDDARLLKFDGPLKAWATKDDMWIRTPDVVLGKKQALSLNGINAYHLKYSPVVSVLSENDSVIRYKVVEE